MQFLYTLHCIPTESLRVPDIFAQKLFNIFVNYKNRFLELPLTPKIVSRLGMLSSIESAANSSPLKHQVYWDIERPQNLKMTCRFFI